jgi:hypothetical protein
MSKFETKKKLLVAESEVYRQLLKLELQTFKVYGTRAKRRAKSVSTYLPMVMTALPFVKAMLGGKRGRAGGASMPSLKRMSSLLMLGWKAYQRFGPFFGRNRFARGDGQPSKTAAEEYLSKRL